MIFAIKSVFLEESVRVSSPKRPPNGRYLEDLLYVFLLQFRILFFRFGKCDFLSSAEIAQEFVL